MNEEKISNTTSKRYSSNNKITKSAKTNPLHKIHWIHREISESMAWIHSMQKSYFESFGKTYRKTAVMNPIFECNFRVRLLDLLKKNFITGLFPKNFRRFPELLDKPPVEECL